MSRHRDHAWFTHAPAWYSPSCSRSTYIVAKKGIGYSFSLTHITGQTTKGTAKQYKQHRLHCYSSTHVTGAQQTCSSVLVITCHKNGVCRELSMTMTVSAAQRGAGPAAPKSFLPFRTAMLSSTRGYRLGVLNGSSRPRVVCCKSQGPGGPQSFQRPAQRLVAPYAPFDQRYAEPK